MENIDNIINFTEKLKVPEGRSKDDIWAELQQKIEKGAKKEQKPIIKQAFFQYSIAASITILFGMFFLMNMNKTTEIIVNAGQINTIFLPDSSEVIINSVSKLSYKSNNWGKDRIVNLNGEAYFKVQKGSTFIVKTQKGIIQVKGTIFNVFCRDNTLEVKCTEGTVLVDIKNNKTIELNKNEGVKFGINNEIQNLNLTKSNSNLWTNGQFYFENTELKCVFKELERQFNIKIKFPEESNRYFTGYFTNKDLNQALKMICKPMKLNFKIEENNQVTITTIH